MSGQLGWLVLTGDDFPLTHLEYFRRWNILQLEVRKHGHLSTRGELIYQGTTFGRKDFLPILPLDSYIFIIRTAKTFRYTTEPLKIEPRDLLNTPLLSSSAFHLLTSPFEAITQIADLLKLRRSCGIEELPIIIWELAPLSCISQNLATCFEAIKVVDVFSPNHIELAALFNTDLGHNEQFDRAIIEDLAYKCLAHGIGSSRQGTIVVRAGSEGCCVYSRKRKVLVWLPSFYQDSPKIVDPTGAGNAFLGGFAIGLLETEDDLMAACYGTVASSFTLEQIGLPAREPTTSLAADGMVKVSEMWNGATVHGRLQEYTLRIGIIDDCFIAPESSIPILGD